MNPLASILVCAVLCPFWWWVAQAAEPLRVSSDPKTKTLGRALYRAAFVTAGVLAVIAAAGVASIFGGVEQVQEAGLF